VFAPTGITSGVKLNEFPTSGGVRSRQRWTLPAYAPRADTRCATPLGARESNVGYVLGPLFDVLGAKALAGRLAADRTDAAVVKRASGDATGGGRGRRPRRTFTVGGRLFAVVGVLPSSFAVFDDRDLWQPAQRRGGAHLGGTRRYAQLPADRALCSPLGRSPMPAPKRRERRWRPLPQAQRANYRLEMQPLRESLVGGRRPVILTFSRRVAAGADRGLRERRRCWWSLRAVARTR
jgi:hypothetical protein